MACATYVARVACCGVLLAALAGCTGGDPEPKASDPTAATSSPAPPASQSPTESPSVAVATGPLLKMPTVEAHAPAGWEKLDQLVPLADTAGDPKGFSSITLSEVDSFDDSTNDELVKIAHDLGLNKGEVVHREDVEVVGVAMYRIVSKEKPTKSFENITYEELGTVYNDQVISIIFNLARSIPEAKRQQIRDEVLASFVWK